MPPTPHAHGFAQENFLIKTGALDEVKDIIVAVDNQNRLTYINKAAVRQYGLEKEKLLGLNLTQLYKQLWFNPEEEEKAILSLKDKGYWEGVNVQLQPDGTKRVVETVVSQIKDETGKKLGLLSISRDITSRVNVDDWLLESNQRLKYAIEAAGMMVYEIEYDTRELVIVRGLEELLGYSVGEVPSTVDWWINQIHPEDKLKAQEQFYPTKPVDKVVNEYRIKLRNGEYIFVQGIAKVLKDKAGKALKIIGSMQDITDRKKAEEQVRRLATVVLDSNDAVTMQDFNGHILAWNLGAKIMYGYTEDEALHLSNLDLVPEPKRREFAIVMYRIQTGEKVVSFETQRLTKDGRILDVWLTVTQLVDESGKATAVATTERDITERKKTEIKLLQRTEELERTQSKLEETAVRAEEYANQMEELAYIRAKQLQEQERMVAIGQTAGMVGHDIRNPLQAIISDVYLVKTELGSIPESAEKNDSLESLTEIERNVDYINKIVQDLQDFARPLNPNTGEADLKLIIDKLLQKNGVPKNVKVTVKVEYDARKFVTDADYLKRILYNLVTNAVQAMPKGGELSITAHKEANDIVLAVKDTGVGIPKDLQSKMFTPMFTTKSKGQGFGLPVVKRMTESLGGVVSFKSKEGKGTTFTVCLPVKSQ